MPNILFVMTDQQRYDTIAAHGNSHILTPNLDRLVRRGVTFSRAYSTCPVCVAARYVIWTGCEPPTTRVFANRVSDPDAGQAATIEGRCGIYLPRRMRQLGYRTFGMGKFHSKPRWDEDLGFEVQLHAEEMYLNPEQRAHDAYSNWIATNHPQFAHLEGLLGERSEMYYMPQTRPLPAQLTVEHWLADRAVEQISMRDDRPWFGFVSFITPHPPFAPPVPFNRMYDPDRLPDPFGGDIAVDHMDEDIPTMNHKTFADDIAPTHARILKARYYGMITFIDHCLGRILDAVEARGDAENTLICFTTDHGDHLGDHHAWQKGTFFDESARIPFLVSWPGRVPAGSASDALVGHADLFALATGAAGAPELREGMDLLGALQDRVPPRQYLIGCYGEPGRRGFKVMVRDGRWKYIHLANGGREQLFDLANDPRELRNRVADAPAETERLRGIALRFCDRPGARAGLDEGRFRDFPHAAPERNRRIYQFDASRGVKGFPANPQDVLRDLR